MGGIFLALVVGYLAGSIPFGLLLSQAAGLGDIRKIGSGNIGATNVLRTGNKSIAALTLLCDVLKGYLPVVLIAHWVGETAGTLAGFAALIGHIFPAWLGFKGGKGVATTLGVLLGWCWPLALIALAAWLGAFTTSRISSAAALTAAIIALVFALVGDLYIQDYVSISLATPVFALAVIVFITHRANIARLLAGTEPRSSFSKTL